MEEYQLNMSTKKPNKTLEILDKVFKDPNTSYGLKEFAGVDFEKALYIFREEKERYFIKDLKGGKSKFVYDGVKHTGKPEEIIRQLWLHKLHTYG